MNHSLGILGGGQLARMLALSAQPLGIPLHILTAHATDPAAQVCANTQLGSLEDEKDLKKFLVGLGAVTFESEFVNTEKLAKCLPSGLRVFPALDAIEAIQDRLTQKQLLDRMKIPTAPWLAVKDKKDLQQAKERFKNGFVLKQRRFGYDGYGTYIFKDGKGDETALLKSPHGFIAEEFVPFKRELAFSVVRSQSARRTLPLVESVQRQSRCYSVHGPLRHPKFSALEKAALKMLDELDYVGILALELFETAKGALIVNELAPRVHNSAHYSQNALFCSQFEYHLRAGLDWPLPEVTLTRKGFAMVNLLGEGGKISLSRKALGFLHWYGKTENRAGRKLGHINTLAGSARAALKQAELWRKDFHL